MPELLVGRGCLWINAGCRSGGLRVLYRWFYLWGGGLLKGAGMRFLAVAFGLAVISGVPSCSTYDFSNEPFIDPAIEVASAPYAVREVTVTVPEKLRVSEADVYYPVADIVWRGEPPGDRHVQVAGVLRDAAALGTADLTRGVPVVAEIEVTRFHALTEKTRYSVGGVYSIDFKLTIRDAETGIVIDGPRQVNGDIPAWGGRRALEDDLAGRTQRKTIVAGLSRTIRAEMLTAAE